MWTQERRWTCGPTRRAGEGSCGSETSPQAGAEPRPDSLTTFHHHVFLLLCSKHLQTLLGQTQHPGHDMVVDTNVCFLPCGYGSVDPWGSQAPLPLHPGRFSGRPFSLPEFEPIGRGYQEHLTSEGQFPRDGEKPAPLGHTQLQMTKTHQV